MPTVRPYGFALYQSYDREAVARALSPEYKFQPQVGTWGLQGIVPFHDGHDYAFFVTLGQVQGEHRFDEAIYESGIVRWQSQPSQGLADRRIRDFISHDENVNDILLFMRARPRSPYLYMGPLRYVNHDLDREKPVHFNWQLIDFSPDALALKESGLKVLPVDSELELAIESPEAVTDSPSPVLNLTSRPIGRSAGLGLSTRKFTAIKIDYVLRDQRNRALGRKGEEMVAQYERESLTNTGRKDLAEKVEIVSETLGDGLGFDVRSFNDLGEEKHIEVKTTSGPASTPFFMTSAEKDYASRCGREYFIYRVFGLDPALPQVSFFMINGDDLALTVSFKPTQFQVVLR
jgi:hypothetical protein